MSEGLDRDDMRLWESPSAQSTLTIPVFTEFVLHINEEHPGDFNRDDWLSFSNPNRCSTRVSSADARTELVEASDEK